MSQTKTNIEEVERRFFAVEMRAPEEGSRRIEGYAALFDTPTDMGGWTEIIERGAFDGADMSNVKARIHHDDKYLMARLRNGKGTLDLEVDEIGLKFGFDAPKTTAGNDLLEQVLRGDLDEASFAFIIAEYRWIITDGEQDIRSLQKFKAIRDVAPVVDAAYPDTTVALRSRPEKPEPKTEKSVEFSEEVRAAIDFHNQLLQAATTSSSND